MSDLKFITDGYFKKYKRKPLKPYNESDLEYARRLYMKMVLESRFLAANDFAKRLAKSYGVDIKEAAAYIMQNPSYIKVLGSKSGIEGGNPIEAIGNGVREVVTRPLAYVGEVIGSAVLGFGGNLIKKLIPLFIVIVIMYLIVVKLPKLAK